MRLRLSDIFADAAALWRGGPQLLVTVAAVFFMLPQLALFLFVGPMKPVDGLDEQAVLNLWLDYFQQNLLWFAAHYIAESMGVGTLLLMLLDPARPSVGEAMARGFRLLPGLIAARYIASLAVTLGLFAFVVPGCYLSGRTFVTSAVYLRERERGPVNAIFAAFGRTHGNGWPLFLVVFTAWGLSVFGGGALMPLAVAAEPLGELVSGPLKALTAAVMAAAMLFAVLLEAAAYRALPPPSTGM
ncbi:hypothetical protein OF829_16900 [Sphingomonas sp. LB-2]|uniref:hypothetical protein n=1 Tax=Sphingomonas caeni TaxID=2984949 RepID=UPI00222E9E05|nr:hypothetical protein [Sphingomonas caeni]MCW3848918.1 hypothetical protein [Sphingomonas caeni]